MSSNRELRRRGSHLRPQHLVSLHIPHLAMPWPPMPWVEYERGLIRRSEQRSKSAIRRQDLTRRSEAELTRRYGRRTRPLPPTMEATSSYTDIHHRGNAGEYVDSVKRCVRTGKSGFLQEAIPQRRAVGPANSATEAATATGRTAPANLVPRPCAHCFSFAFGSECHRGAAPPIWPDASSDRCPYRMAYAFVVGAREQYLCYPAAGHRDPLGQRECHGSNGNLGREDTGVLLREVPGSMLGRRIDG